MPHSDYSELLLAEKSIILTVFYVAYVVRDGLSHQGQCKEKRVPFPKSERGINLCRYIFRD